MLRGGVLYYGGSCMSIDDLPGGGDCHQWTVGGTICRRGVEGVVGVVGQTVVRVLRVGYGCILGRHGTVLGRRFARARVMIVHGRRLSHGVGVRLCGRRRCCILFLTDGHSIEQCISIGNSRDARLETAHHLMERVLAMVVLVNAGRMDRRRVSGCRAKCQHHV